jgi:hypothetical protein
MDIINDVTYKHVKFYYAIHCIVRYTQKTKFDKFLDLKNFQIKIFVIFVYRMIQDILIWFFACMWNK